MKEIDTLGIFTHVETFIAFLVFLVPGAISLRTYDAKRGGEGRKINDALDRAALGWYELRTRLAKSGVIADLVLKTSGKFFGTILRERLDIGLTPPGFASTYPADKQLHVSIGNRHYHKTPSPTRM